MSELLDYGAAIRGHAGSELKSKGQRIGPDFTHPQLNQIGGELQGLVRFWLYDGVKSGLIAE